MLPCRCPTLAIRHVWTWLGLVRVDTSVIQMSFSLLYYWWDIALCAQVPEPIVLGETAAESHWQRRQPQQNQPQVSTGRLWCGQRCCCEDDCVTPSCPQGRWGELSMSAGSLSWVLAISRVVKVRPRYQQGLWGGSSLSAELLRWVLAVSMVAEMSRPHQGCWGGSSPSAGPLRWVLAVSRVAEVDPRCQQGGWDESTLSAGSQMRVLAVFKCPDPVFPSLSLFCKLIYPVSSFIIIVL